MKKALDYFQVAAVAAILLVAPGCPGVSRERYNDFQTSYANAINPEGPGGEAITAEESAELTRLFAEYVSSVEDTDWQEVLTGAGLAAASIASTKLIGIDLTKLIPTVKVNGKPLAGKLANVETPRVKTPPSA